MAEIDNLSIQVTANAEEAARTLDRLASSAGRLRGAAAGAAGGMQEAAQGAQDMGMATQQAGTQAGKARPNIKGVGRDAQDAGENAKKGASGLSTFWQSLKRIAYYRMIRSIIKAIGQAFKEGAQNLYQWSAANSSLSDFKKNMDRIATSALYLKNSLGAMLEPIVRVLAPIIETVVDGLVWIINHVNMLFAALSGSQTYTVAKKVATTWGDAAEDVATSTHKAAEDIKRTLLGFDEINRLEKPNTSSFSGGNGGNNNNNNFNDMFETRQLDGWMAALAKFIDDTKTAIPAVLSAILVPFEAIKKAVEGIAEKTKEWVQDLGTLGALVIEVPVSLIRSGWTTIKNWVTSFGAAVVDVVVSLTSAGALWSGLQNAWDAIGEKALSVGISASTTASGLWKSLQKAWGDATDHVLSVTASIATTASSLWTSLQTSWGSIPNHVLSVYLDLATTAKSLWTNLQTAWGSIPNHVLSVYLDLATKASTLWTDLQIAWGSIPNHILNVYLDLATKASDLWTNLQTAWGSIPNHILNVYLDLATKASDLWMNLQTAWGSIPNHILNVYLDLATTASSLWTSLQVAWGSLSDKALSVYLDLATTAQSLWTKLQTAWGSIPNHVLNVYLSIVTGVETLWSDLSAAWGESKDRVLDVAISTSEKIKTATNNVWGWIKENWEVVAGGGLGVGIVLTTPWTEISAALSGLWGNVMTSLGGSVALSIAPVLGAITAEPNPNYPKASSLMPSVSYYDNSTGEFVIKAKPVDVEINATPGTGISSVDIDGKFNLKGVNGANTAISASAGKGISSISSDGKLNLNGVNNTSTTINATAGTGFSSMGNTNTLSSVGALSAEVNATAGTGMTLNSNKLGVNYGTLNTSGTVNVNGKAGDGIVFSNTNHHYTLAGVDNANATVNVSPSAAKGLTLSDGVFSLTTVKGASATVTAKPSAGKGLKLNKDKEFSLSKVLGASATVTAKGKGTNGITYSAKKGYSLGKVAGTTAQVTAGIDKGKSSAVALNALSAGNLVKGVSLAVGVSGLDATTGTVGEVTFGDISQSLSVATDTLVGFLNVYDKLQKNDSKNLKVKVSDQNTVGKDTENALKMDKNTDKNVLFSLKSKQIGDYIALALSGVGKTLTGAIQYTIEVAKKSVNWLADALASFFTPKKAIGGVFSNGMWSNIPQYAGGTVNAHGSLFMAGEAGPEIVGHVGGRTEVLNKSQLAATMYSAVRSAMSGVTLDANFYGDTNEGYDYDTLYKAMYDAFSAVMARNEDRDREKVALLRSINEKDFTPEITASSIARGMNRMNRRAGTTVVPVGT